VAIQAGQRSAEDNRRDPGSDSPLGEG